MFNKPSIPKESLINIVEIIKPELRITRLNLSVCKSEINSSSTSVKISMVKQVSKNILLTSCIEPAFRLTSAKLT